MTEPLGGSRWRGRLLPFLLLPGLGCAAPDAPETPSPGAENVDTTNAAGRSWPASVSDSSDHYVVEITYPQAGTVPIVLVDSMQAWAEASRREFMGSVDEFRSEPLDSFHTATQPWTFELGFAEYSRVAGLLSVKGEGYMYTGGAHGLSLHGTFVYDLRKDRMLTLTDLIADATALVLISDFVRQALEDSLAAEMTADADEEAETRVQLREWIDEGAAPAPDNYALFLVEPGEDDRAVALTFLFPPYQVAPYAAGPREVAVPGSIFAGALRSAYRDRFAAPSP